MTPKSQIFHTYTPSLSNKKITVANGSIATVAVFGDIYITPKTLGCMVWEYLSLSNAQAYPLAEGAKLGLPLRPSLLRL